MAVLSSASARGARCQCQEGRGAIGGKCKNLFTQAGCSPGHVLLPETVTEPCPAQFSCQPAISCPGYNSSLAEIRDTTSQELKLEKMLLMESLVCGRGQYARSVCCPEFTASSMLSTPVLLASLRSASGVSCYANPCPAGRWPWADQDGPARCLPAAEGVKDCETEIEEVEGRLECLNITVLKISNNLVGENCGRRKRFSYGRCVRIF